MRGRRVLITGAGGFTGRHAVNYFVQKGAAVTAVLRQQIRPGDLALPLFPDGVQVYICELSDRQAVARMVGETAPDEILHLAGKNSVPESWENPLLYMETNVMSTLYLLEAARSNPSIRVLVAGSGLKYRIGTALPPHPYSLTKTLEELVSLAWGTLFKQQILLAEPCNLMGPGPSTGFCSLLAEHIIRSERGEPRPPFKLSSRLTLRDFLDVRDAVKAYERILEKGQNGTIYRIGSGEQRKLGEIAERLLQLSGAPIPMDWGPDPEGVGGSTPAPSPSSPNRVRDSIPVSGRAVPLEVDAADLGWQAEIPLDRSLSDIMDYFRSGTGGGIR
ncbi:NAD-dependent epimerase/dehydratase family protein [Paenibacillus sp. sgz500958]|uniref:NAD-dependent epimerase/dehydratase family protein n=1 Tax=Paenibacillus sp. sgz500958 TaxID=3242475 RepID=UPI0036D35804